MNWITYVFQHFYIIFIILAIVSGLLKRKGSALQGQPGNKMPPFSGNATGTLTSREQTEQRTAQEWRQAKLTEDRIGRTLLEERREETGRSERLVTLEIAPPLSVSSLSLADGGTRNIAGSLDPLNGDNLIQGIIWSEVLGKPRAKLPYRR